jgi:hypothetical protein
MAMARCAKLGQWLAQIFRDLQFARYIGKNANLVEMRRDNQGALALVKNPTCMNARSTSTSVFTSFET